MTKYELDMVRNLLNETEQKCKKAYLRVQQTKSDYQNAKSKYIFDDEKCLIDDAKIEMECAIAKLNALVDSKISIEILYKKLKKNLK